MQTFANQKVVTVYKQTCNRDHLYMTLNLQALERAAKVLSYGAFKLFIYFAKNQDGYCFALSSKDVTQNFGMSRSAYNSAIHELIKEGYLVQVADNSNCYNFEELIDA